MAAVTSLLGNLSRLLTSHTGLVSGAAEEIEIQRLINELVLLNDVFQGFAKKAKKKDEGFREVERQIKEFARDAEDTVDSCLTHLTAAKYSNIIWRRRCSPDLNRRPPVDLAEQVKSIREDKLKPLLDKLVLRTDFGGGDDESGTNSIEEQRPRVTRKALPINRYIVGFQDEEWKIITYLMDEGEELDVGSIVGMPGLGKTTLAWKIYQSNQIKYAFPFRIWVTVSQEFTRRTLFLSILQEFTSKDMSSESDHDLAQAVRACFQEKKFFLVLDDVWTLDAWDAIRDALPMSNGRGKVLITSRFSAVAVYANPKRPPHVLRFLTDEEGWLLLSFKLFGEHDGCPADLQNIGKLILRKCNGWPILIVTIAGILVDQLSKSSTMNAIVKAWEQFYQSLSMFRTNEHVDIFTSVLALCYDMLHDELRDCYLYLGVFPEDYEIPVWTLYQLWIAEGFIQPEEGRSLEEIAEENLNNLIHRNLVMVDKFKADGKVKSCRIHDTVRDFCINEAEKKENLFKELRRVSGDGSFGPHLKKHRRLCIHFDVLDFFSPEPNNVPYTRSFLNFSKEESALQTEDIPKIPSAFELIRVLHARSIRFRIFPRQLTQLIHLKYVVLSSDFKVLPEAVSELRNIHTLIIQTSSRTLVVKADLWKMIQLRHVKTNASIIYPKQPEANEGKNLQTLANISPENCTTGLFEHTPNLKKLGIRGRLGTLLDSEVGSKIFGGMGKLSVLENLKLLNDVQTVSPSEGRLRSLPQPDTFPPRLKILTLSATFLSWEQMPVLGKLENLEVLKLKDKAFVGECWEVAADGGFRLLKFLRIEFTDLVSWKLAIGGGDHFPSLKRITLRNCEELDALPDGLASIPSLEAMDLFRTSKTAANSAMKIHQEMFKRREMSKRRLNLSIFHVNE